MKYGLFDKQLKEITSIIASYKEIEAAVLFGSRAIDTFKEASDVDIAIKGTQADCLLAAKLKNHLEEETFLPFFFDVVAHSSISSQELIKHIRTKGQVLFRRSISEWKEVRLGDVAVLHYGKALKSQNRITGNVPVYGSAGIIGYHNTAIFESKGIIIGRKGTIGKITKSTIPFYCIDTAYYVLPDDKKYNFDFIFHKLKTLKLNELNSDSAVPGLNRNTAYEQKFLLPPLPEQKAIAEVLSSLDDKIDLLHRQNKTLEGMAEALFRQWFVEEADDHKPLGECIKTISGGTPSRKKIEYYEGGIFPWVKSKELNRGYLLNTEEKITEEALKNSSAKVLPKNSILIAMYGATAGQFAIIGQKATCNQAICACIPNEKYPYTFIYYTIKTNEIELKNRAVGSAQQNISQVLIKSLDIGINKKKVSLFHEYVDPMMTKIKSNTKKIRTLEKMRDMLLPKLMNGEVKIKP